MAITEDLVKKAAETYGFNLEFRTKQIFEKLSYQTELNKHLKIDNDNQFTEIDVLAHSQNENRSFIIECKGMQKDSALILIKESSDSLDDVDSRRSLITDSSYRVAGFYQSHLDKFYTFSGDFFTLKSNNLTKMSKNDDENNFYKGQIQIINGIRAFCMLKAETYYHLIPIIVTNSEIWVVDYEKGGAENYKWALHRITTI